MFHEFENRHRLPQNTATKALTRRDFIAAATTLGLVPGWLQAKESAQSSKPATTAVKRAAPSATPAALQGVDPRQLIAVTCEKAGRIDLIDGASGVWLHAHAVGERPRGLAFSSDGRLMFVSDAAKEALWVVETLSGRIRQKIAVGDSPEAVYRSPDGRWIAVAVEEGNQIALIDSQRWTQLGRIKTQGANPEHAVFSPDSQQIWVSAENADQVDVLDVATRRLITSVQVGQRPRGIAFTKDGTLAFVACEMADHIAVVDRQSMEVVRRIESASRVNGLAVAQRQQLLFASNGSGTVSVIDIPGLTLVASIAVGKRPWNLAVNADETHVYVANGRSNSVSRIEIASLQVTQEIPVGELPWGAIAVGDRL